MQRWVSKTNLTILSTWLRIRHISRPVCDVKIQIMVRLQFWKFNKCPVSRHCHYCQVNLPVVFVPVRVTSVAQIDLFKNYTGLQRNWGKHKNTRFCLIWGCGIQIWNPFLLIISSFLDMHSVHFVHIRYIKVYMNSGVILILWDLWLIF